MLRFSSVYKNYSSFTWAIDLCTQLWHYLALLLYHWASLALWPLMVIIHCMRAIKSVQMRVRTVLFWYRLCLWTWTIRSKAGTGSWVLFKGLWAQRWQRLSSHLGSSLDKSPDTQKYEAFLDKGCMLNDPGSCDLLGSEYEFNTP